MGIFLLPWQVGKLKYPAMHVSHLSPETLSIQAHTPLVTSQVSSADPTALQAHAIK